MLTALPESTGKAEGHTRPGRDRMTRVAARGSAICPYIIDTAEAARIRFPHLESNIVRGAQQSDSISVTIGLPLSYHRNKRRRYPLLVLSDGNDLLGSAIEMVRVLAATREARECIVVSHDDAWLAPADADAQATRLVRIVDLCGERFRVARGEVAVFASGRGMASARRLLTRQPRAIDRWIVLDDGSDQGDWLALAAQTSKGRTRIAWTGARLPDDRALVSTAFKRVPEAAREGLCVPALTHGIRTLWGTSHQYGEDMMPLSRPWVARAVTLAKPLIRWLRAPHALAEAGVHNRHVLRSDILDRDFEIFVNLPHRVQKEGATLPMVIALDANSTWSCVAETASRMARAGEIEDVIVVGIGVPRAEGDIAFGLRRFEELSPPAGPEAFESALGRFFLSIFALFGRDARAHFGLAPQFHRFLVGELLPALLQSLPADPSRLCLVGHSAAGTYAAFELAQPDTPFDRFAILSPGVAISDDWMLKPEGGLDTEAPGRQVLVAIGAEEQHNAFNMLAGIPQSSRYVQALRMRAPTARIDYTVLDRETHTTMFPRALAMALAHHFKPVEEQ